MPEFRKRNIGIIAASVDSVAKARAMAERTGAAFTILSDPQGQLIDYFKVWHRGTPKGDIAIASSFLFDRDGRLIWHDITDNYKIRPRPQTIFAAQDAYAAKKQRGR